MNDFLKKINNNVYLKDKEINTLSKYNIDFEKANYSEILFLIDELNIDDEELDLVAEDISERNYYNNINK